MQEVELSKVQARWSQRATDPISILGRKLRCGSIAVAGETQVRVVRSLHWQTKQKKTTPWELSFILYVFKWETKSKLGDYKLQGSQSGHRCKKKGENSTKAVRMYENYVTFQALEKRTGQRAGQLPPEMLRIYVLLSCTRRRRWDPGRRRAKPGTKTAAGCAQQEMQAAHCQTRWDWVGRKLFPKKWDFKHLL